jgi:hypothetical protein
VKKSAPRIAPQCARKKTCHDVGRSGTGGIPGLSESERPWSARHDGRRSSARRGSACSPTWDSPRPCAPPGAGSPRARLDGSTLASRTSISAP